MPQQTLINGNRYSFTSIDAVASVTGAPIAVPKGALQGINYTGSVDPGLVQGNQQAPVGRTGGYGTSEGDFEILAAEADDFNAALTGGGTFPLTGVDFDWTVGYGVNDIDTRIDVLRGCRIISVESPNAKGNDASVKRYRMSIMRVRLNGVDVYADPQT
jgi:hypothetical protein